MAEFSAITFTNLKTEIENYLKVEHNKAGILFSAASPFGQILTVVENLHQLSILYLKNAISQFDLGDANSNNERVIKNAAILAGHIPFRSISASGTLKFTIKNDGKAIDTILRFLNKTTLQNKTNGLKYSLDLGKLVELVPVNTRLTNSPYYFRIIQGKWITRTFTGSGDPMQTYSIQDTDGKDVENFNCEVSVNGIIWAVKKHIYDLLPNELSCVVRTGFNGGIDIIFGNGGFGYIPELSTRITVRYLQSDGSAGNIYRRDVNDWKFEDDIFNSSGETVNAEELFDIEIFNDINFGSDAEDYRFTKSLLPIATNNFVLALPQHYAYELKKLGIFTLVNAEEKNGTIYIYVVPDIRLFKRKTENYFTIPLVTSVQNTAIDRRKNLSDKELEKSGKKADTKKVNTALSSAFELDSYERQKITNYLRSSGVIQLTRKFVIRTPKVSKYVMIVHVIRFKDAKALAVKKQIASVMSDYFLNLTRLNRIPRSEIIRLIQNLPDVYSCDVEFVSQKNEDYHRNYTATGYNVTLTPGLDPKLGDILFNADELPVLRGDFYHRNNQGYYVDEDPSMESSINGPVIYDEIGEVDRKETRSPDPKKIQG
jgi:hypothetical protein